MKLIQTRLRRSLQLSARPVEKIDQHEPAKVTPAQVYYS